MLLFSRPAWKRPQDRKRKPCPKRKGATMMEYLMMISLIVVVCLVAIGYLGTNNGASMGSSANSISKSLKKGS